MGDTRTTHAKKLAAGERLVLRVSGFARNDDGHASEEAQRLHELRELGLDIVADDPSVLARGERELKQLVDATVRDSLAEAMAKVDIRLERCTNIDSMFLGNDLFFTRTSSQTS